MITRDGRAKVLDFGLAKLIERAPAEATITEVATEAGVVMGTAAYMSPEQAEGGLVTGRSDIFSFGAVLYEMLTGRRPFGGTTNVSVITAILRDQPAPLRTVRPDVPTEVDAIVARSLAKDPAARYQSAADLRAELAAAHARLTRAPDSAWRRPRVLVPVAVLLLGVAGFSVWQLMKARAADRVRREMIPQIEKLQYTNRSLDAVRLAEQASRIAPEEIRRIRDKWFDLDITTVPAGATVAIRNYTDLDGQWHPFGTTPIRGSKVPFVSYRVRITKAGFVPVDVNHAAGPLTVTLVEERAAEPGMVRVEGGPFSVGVAAPVTLPAFWIDKYELTNREFKKFVDGGGYSERKYWTEPFVDGQRTLSFEEAVARFRDATGRSGPATWELGSYPDGKEDFPVGGISWYEAAAYARFAGKELPTIYHWYRSTRAAEDAFSDILKISNFDARGPVKVGERQSVGVAGTYDMAGNIKEWCANRVGDGHNRYILGGGWNEPVYRFSEPEARDPWRRDASFGVRLVKNVGALSAAASAPVPAVHGDPASLVPVADNEFQLYKRFYDYDRLPLDARVEAVDESPHWKKEKVSFTAAYGGERIPAYLFLPKNARPPYQTIVFFPTSYATAMRSSAALDLWTFEFIVRSGRAVLYPVYQGTFERLGPPLPRLGAAWRDRLVQRTKDFFRAVDYLETRPEIDKEKLAYYSLSLGAYSGPIPVALDPRIKVAAFAAGGMRFDYPPEVQPANFMPRVKVPVLVVHGRDDFQVPIAGAGPLLRASRHAAGAQESRSPRGGHVPDDMHALYREVLDWFDKYLGPVK